MKRTEWLQEARMLRFGDTKRIHAFGIAQQLHGRGRSPEGDISELDKGDISELL